MAPFWRKSNGGILQVSRPGARNSYNGFQEARKMGGRIEAFGNALLNFTCAQLGHLMANLELVVKAPQPRRLQQALTKAYTVRQAKKMYIYSWANIFHSTGPHATENFIGQVH